MSDDMDITVDHYLPALIAAYTVAKEDHRAKLEGRSFPQAWEGNGIHAFSRAVGVVEALFDFTPPEFHVGRNELATAARRDAAAEYEQERFEDWSLRMRLERRVNGHGSSGSRATARADTGSDG